MSWKMISPDDELKLTGRIYPAVKSCVNNILIGLLAYYAFIFRSDRFRDIILGNRWVPFFVSVAFVVFVSHNSWNYYLNVKEQFGIEKNTTLKWYQVLRESSMELSFAIIITAFIIGSHIFFIDP